MIGRLTGQVATYTPTSLVLDVGGVGYSLQIPLSTFYAISSGSNGAVTLHIHTHVREEALALYGFATLEEKSAFERLIAVSGVGPKMALAVLSGIEVPDLEAAVREGERGKLERIPGIGRKTAERILLELRDRLGREPRAKAVRTRAGAAGEKPPGAGPTADARSALVNLGYSRDAAERAVDEAGREAGPEADLETVLRAALRALMRS